MVGSKNLRSKNLRWLASLPVFGSKNLRDWFWQKFVIYNKIATIPGYLIPFALQAIIYCPATKENAIWFRNLILVLWVPPSLAFYSAALAGHFATSLVGRGVQHFLWFYGVDAPFATCLYAAIVLIHVLDRQSENRLISKSPKFHGNRICVLGNGPSLVKGEPLGKYIDGMDEVVRFNNFQTKTSGYETWTGEKCTVHFSDSMLYPSYPEYHVPGATVALSLFMDRLMVAGSYFIFRSVADLAFKEAYQMMMDPTLGWLPHEDISNLQVRLGLSKWKHPTSGCLAIDWFVRHRPDPSVPVYIAGFDFFEGPQIHYYDGTEPLYERINDLIGVKTMHEPHKEKAYVNQLVSEGKVKWLKDFTPGCK